MSSDGARLRRFASYCNKIKKAKTEEALRKIQYTWRRDELVGFCNEADWELEDHLKARLVELKRTK